MVGLDGSGNTRKCSPLFKLYSVMPSAEVTFCTPLGRPWAGHSTGARKTAVTRNKLSSLFCGFIFLSYPNSTSACGAWRTRADLEFCPTSLVRHFDHELAEVLAAEQLLQRIRESLQPFDDVFARLQLTGEHPHHKVIPLAVTPRQRDF